jgi:hypothetical protein
MASNLIKFFILVLSAWLLNSNAIAANFIDQNSDIEIIQHQEKTPPQLSLSANVQTSTKILLPKKTVLLQQNFSLYAKSAILLKLTNYQNSQITALHRQQYLTTTINIDAFIQRLNYPTNFTENEHHFITL